MNRNVKKVTRVQLEGTSSDKMILIGLVSAEPDYKLSLLINRKLRISLRNVAPLTVQVKPAGDMHFSRFTAALPETGVTFTIIANRSGRDSLLKQFEKIDYILIVHGPARETDETSLVKALRETESVTAVFSIDPDTVRDKNIQYLIR